MSTSAPRPSRAESSEQDLSRNAEATRPGSFAAIPGWMISGALHAAVIVFLITSGLPSCGEERGGIGSGADSGEFRDVGIYIKQPDDSPESPEESPDESPETEQPNENASKVTQETKQATDVETIASDLLSVPEVKAPAVIGQSRTGASSTGVPNIAESAIVTPNAVRSPKSNSPGPGKVSFMGKTAVAQKVVFVIDTSSSMDNHEAMRYAKAKLKQSINGLTQAQRFQIISYTLTANVMRLPNDTAKTPTLYPAIGPNLRLATYHINGMTAKGGTNHEPALKAALGYKPDVVFFLTDADDDRLTESTLALVRKDWNKDKKAHLHCIKFGEGPDLNSRTGRLMKRLADENSGSYSYLDVSRLDSR